MEMRINPALVTFLIVFMNNNFENIPAELLSQVFNFLRKNGVNYLN